MTEQAMTDNPLPPLSVLIVDDYEDAADSTAELLVLCGHAVRVVRCGADALREVAAEMPDVVLLDIGLPDMDGWQVAERMRRQAKGKQPLVVAVTGYATESDRYQSADAGVDLHLSKPADPVSLTRLLTWVRENLPPRRTDSSSGTACQHDSRPDGRCACESKPQSDPNSAG